MGSTESDFERLFAVEFAPVLRTVFLICQDHHRAEDVTQEAFVQLLRHWEKVSRFDRPGAWVRRVAIRIALRSLRRDGRQRAAEDAFWALPRAHQSGDLDVLAAVRSLPGRQRAAVVLFYFEDAPLNEIAKVLGCTPSTAGVHLYRARQRLGQVLEEVRTDGRRPSSR